MIKIKDLSLDYMMDLTKSDPEFRKKLFRVTEKEIKQDLDKIIEARNEKDYKAAGGVVHKFKSKLDLFNLRASMADVIQIEETLQADPVDEVLARNFVNEFIFVQKKVLELFEKYRNYEYL